MPEIVPLRGRVYMADIGNGPKPWVIVSNNDRNRKLGTACAVRVTTTAKPKMDSIVELDSADPLVGRILCDDMVQLYRDELKSDVGAMSPATMVRVNKALAFALGLPTR
jgi:mRNA interferase MazF